MAARTKPDSSRGIHHDSVRQRVRLVLLGATAIWGLAALAGPSSAPAEVHVPVINADIGTCTADFTVKDSDSKPIYDAKIRVSIKHGFMGQRKTDLEIGTNSDGKARFEGLPDKKKKPKGPIEYQIRAGELTKTIVQDPLVQCEANFDVVLQK
jgi:hypothetical protein